MQVGEQNSSLSYLRLLQSSRSALSTLVDDLKAINYKGIQGMESVGSISATLDQNLDDLFVPYLENSRYIDREVKSLQELYSSLLYKFNGFHVYPENKLTNNSPNASLCGIRCWIDSLIKCNQVLIHLWIL
jgi:hypothetical protein